MALLTFCAATAHSNLVVPLFAAGVIVARTAGGSIPDRAGALPTLTAATAAASAGLLLIAVSDAKAAAVAGTVMLALGQGLAVPALGVLALARVPAERHGAAAGLFFAFFDAGVGAGGPVVGVAARLTSPAGSLVFAAAAVAAAGALQTGAR